MGIRRKAETHLIPVESNPTPPTNTSLTNINIPPCLSLAIPLNSPLPRGVPLGPLVEGEHEPSGDALDQTAVFGGVGDVLFGDPAVIVTVNLHCKYESRELTASQGTHSQSVAPATQNSAISGSVIPQLAVTPGV